VRLEVGQSVLCSDGVFGELADLVIDPTQRRVTHLVVQPHHQHSLARLVPIELAEPDGDSSAISLRCTVEDVRRLAPVQEFAYLRLGEFPLDDPDWDVGVQNMLAIPYYSGAGLAGPRPPERRSRACDPRLPAATTASKTHGSLGRAASERGNRRSSLRRGLPAHPTERIRSRRGRRRAAARPRVGGPGTYGKPPIRRVACY
jgi:hypothetical protein